MYVIFTIIIVIYRNTSLKFHCHGAIPLCENQILMCDLRWHFLSSPLPFLLPHPLSPQYVRFCQWKYLEVIQPEVITPDDFTIHRIIGRGGFGEVYGCRKDDSGRM